MSNNPLRQTRYDIAAFRAYNWGIRKAIAAYEYDEAIRRQGRYPKARIIDGERYCADPVCDTKLTHLRSFLCEAHREGRYQATKRKTRRTQ
jgi:hypothetical protein